MIEPQQEPADRQVRIPASAWGSTLFLTVSFFLLFILFGRLPQSFTGNLWGLAHFRLLNFFGLLQAGLIFILPVLLIRRSFAEEQTEKNSQRSILIGLLSVLFAAPVICFYFRQTHTMLGDSFFLLSFIPETISRIGKIPLSVDEPLATMVNGWAVKTAFAFKGSTELALRLVSVAASIVAFPFIYLLVRRIGLNRWPGTVGLFLLIITSGLSGLFFGTIEAYAWAMALLIGFIYFSFRTFETGKGFYLACLFLGAAIAFHLLSLTAVPALLWLAWSRIRSGDKLLKVFLSLILTGLPLFVTWIIIIFSGSFQLIPESHLANVEMIPFLTGDEPYFRYRLFDPRHLLDVANQWLLTALPFLLLTPLLWRVWLDRIRQKDPVFFFLALLVVCFSAFGFLWNPGRGYYADWDLFSFVGLGPVVLAAWSVTYLALEKTWQKVIVLAMLFVSFLHLFYWIMGNSLGYVQSSSL